MSSFEQHDLLPSYLRSLRSEYRRFSSLLSSASTSRIEQPPLPTFSTTTASFSNKTLDDFRFHLYRFISSPLSRMSNDHGVARDRFERDHFLLIGSRSWYTRHSFHHKDLYGLLVEKDTSQLRSFCLSFIPYANDGYERTACRVIDETLSTREMMIVAIVEYARVGSLPQCRRIEEKHVMEMSDPEREVVFVCLNGIQVPREVMQVVISYLQIGVELFGFGLVCWDWYLLALTSWTTVTVTNLNLYSIPLPILWSVSVLKIGSCPNWSSVDERPVALLSELHETELDYMWAAINAKNLSVLELPNSRLQSFEMLLNSLSRSTPLEGLRKIVFGAVGHGEMLGDFLMRLPRARKIASNCDLSTIAPNLRSIRYPPMIEMCFEGVESVAVRYSQKCVLTEDDLRYLLQFRSLRSVSIVAREDYRRCKVDITVDGISNLWRDLLPRMERFQASGMLWNGLVPYLPPELPLLRRLQIHKTLDWRKLRSSVVDVRMPVIEELELLGMRFQNQVSLLESESLKTGLRFLHCSSPNLPLRPSESLFSQFSAKGQSDLNSLDFELPKVTAASFARVIAARACSSQKMRVTSMGINREHGIRNRELSDPGAWIEFRDFGRILVLSFCFAPNTRLPSSCDHVKSPQTLRWLFGNDEEGLLRTRCREVRCTSLGLSEAELEAKQLAILASLPKGWRFFKRFDAVEDIVDHRTGTHPRRRVLCQGFKYCEL